MVAHADVALRTCACCAVRLQAWLTILQLHETAPALSAACLHTVSLYVPWIPIGLVANPVWLGLLQPFLHTAALHDGACAVLMEIVLKRMDADAKMEHLQQVRVVSMLTEGVALGVVVTTKLASLVAALAMELLDCWDKLAGLAVTTARAAQLAGQAVELLSHAFPLLLQCFASDDMDTSQSTLAFLHAYIGRLRKLLPSPKQLASQEGHLQHLLMVLCRRSVHPPGYDFDAPDEAEETFDAYRRELSTLFKGVARVHAGLAQECVPQRRTHAGAVPPAAHTHPVSDRRWSHCVCAHPQQVCALDAITDAGDDARGPYGGAVGAPRGGVVASVHPGRGAPRGAHQGEGRLLPPANGGPAHLCRGGVPAPRGAAARLRAVRALLPLLPLATLVLAHRARRLP